MKSWLEFNCKYKNRLRDFMSEKEERIFIEDYSSCCEAEGFNKVFWTPFEENKEHIGKKFRILRRVAEEECYLDTMPMWEIELEDGTVFCAFPEEIVPSEMKLNNCPEKYLNEKENVKMIKTWEELEAKYPEDRACMTAEREREYVNDLSNCFENEGLNKVFWSPYGNIGETEYYGKPFKVLGRTSEIRNNLQILPLWDIEFEDGKQLTVEPSEIFTNAMKDNGCPKEYLIKVNSIEEKENLEKDSLYAQLMLKIHQELFSYKESLYRMTVDEVIEEAYKLTMFKEFICVFETFATNYLNITQLKDILKISNILESLYEHWLHYVSEEQEIYHEFIFGVWAEEKL